MMSSCSDTRPRRLPAPAASGPSPRAGPRPGAVRTLRSASGCCRRSARRRPAARVRLTRTPLTRVPLVEPRSTTTKPSPSRTDLGVAAAHVGVGEHDRRTRACGRRSRPARRGVRARRRQHSEPAPTPPGPSCMRPSIVNEPGVQTVVGLERRPRPGPGTRSPRRGRARGPRRHSSRAEACRRSRRSGRGRRGSTLDGEVVGHDRAAPDVDRAVVVHLADQAPAELDRAQPAPEDAGEHALDHALEPALEPLETHEGPRYPARQASVQVAIALSLLTRASGGIGRRAGFRFLCPKGRGGSSPPSPT